MDHQPAHCFVQSILSLNAFALEGARYWDAAGIPVKKCLKPDACSPDYIHTVDSQW